MSRGTKIIIVIVGGLVLIGGIIWFIVAQFYTPSAPAPVANTNTNAPAGSLGSSTGTPNGGTTVLTPPPVPAQAPVATVDRTAVQLLAVNFAERVGSYSNQSDFSNFADLEPVVSAEVYSYMQGDYRAGLAKTLPPSTDYYGVTAKVVDVTALDNDDQTGEATLSVQRTESGTVTKTGYAILELKVSKTTAGWIVSNFKWH
jgi:hypothetical protein